VAPVRLKRRHTWRLVLAFLALLIILFGLSFIISYNMLRGETSSDAAKIADMQQTIDDQNSTIDDLKSQLAGGGAITPTDAPAATTSPKASATAKPAATKAPSATAKPAATKAPTATAKPAATAKPTVVPTADITAE